MHRSIIIGQSEWSAIAWCHKWLIRRHRARQSNSNLFPTHRASHFLSSCFRFQDTCVCGFVRAVSVFNSGLGCNRAKPVLRWKPHNYRGRTRCLTWSWTCDSPCSISTAWRDRGDQIVEPHFVKFPTTVIAGRSHGINCSINNNTSTIEIMSLTIINHLKPVFETETCRNLLACINRTFADPASHNFDFF